MPTYHVTIAGKTYAVEVPNPHERPVRAIIEGEELLVELAQASAAASAVSVVTPTQPKLVPAPAPAATGKAGDISAPLPGTVISISVDAGDTVERGQELCVIEAMKMNNPIRATQTGTVEAIHVRIGQQIQHGTPLMRIGA